MAASDRVDLAEAACKLNVNRGADVDHRALRKVVVNGRVPAVKPRGRWSARRANCPTTVKALGPASPAALNFRAIRPATQELPCCRQARQWEARWRSNLLSKDDRQF